ncbi:hypothetical protein ABPG77_011239 [Micractinium sp. CCAP 211/92]
MLPGHECAVSYVTEPSDVHRRLGTLSPSAATCRLPLQSQPPLGLCVCASWPHASAMEALAMAAPPLAASYPPVPDCSARSSDDSLASSSSELPHTAAAVPQSQQHLPEEPEQRTHHLLKHCLSQSQRGSALQHFNTTDAREAAKEIARMGQRELQAKFKEVYGSATKSNNNSWLRRKLYEAVGVAPLKANTKGKARKGAASAHRKAGGSHSSKSRSPKAPAPAPKAKRAAELPASPVQGGLLGGGMSILDLHQHSGLLSADTSDSEDCASHGNHGFNSACDSPRSPLGRLAPLSVRASCGVQQTLAPAPAGFVPMTSCGMPAEPLSPLAAGLHWADGFAAHEAQPHAPFLSTSSAAMAPEGAPLGPPCGSPNPMDLEQDAAQLWEGGDPQPWYFGGSMDLGLSLPLRGVTGTSLASLPMDSCNASGTCCGVEDDEVPLLTLDLGAIDVSI